MKINPVLFSNLFCLGLAISTAALASDFQTIRQPSTVRFGVTALGLGLIGLELWWFLGKRKSQP